MLLMILLRGTAAAQVVQNQAGALPRHSGKHVPQLPQKRGRRRPPWGSLKPRGSGRNTISGSAWHGNNIIRDDTGENRLETINCRSCFLLVYRAEAPAGPDCVWSFGPCRRARMQSSAGFHYLGTNDQNTIKQNSCKLLSCCIFIGCNFQLVDRVID